MSKKRVAVLISGRGSNLQSLLDAAAAPDYPAEVVLVLSNRPNAPGLERARSTNVPTNVIDHRTFGTGETARTDFDSALSTAIEEANVDFVCLAGFMRILTDAFVERWRGKLINIHPSLLPSFKGLDVHQRMIASGVKIAGCTVHFVTEEMDGGPIIGQSAVPVLPGDDAETLAARILAEEHRLYPACLRLLANGDAEVNQQGVVRFKSNFATAGAVQNPQ